MARASSTWRWKPATFWRPWTRTARAAKFRIEGGVESWDLERCARRGTGSLRNLAVEYHHTLRTLLGDVPRQRVARDHRAPGRLERLDEQPLLGLEMPI